MNNQCHCCLQRPSARDLRKPFTHLGITESYSAMFEECFAIHLIIDSGREQGICLECVDQLRGACHFKLQVLQCQADLQEHWGWQQHVKAETDTEAHTEVVNTEIDADILKEENTEDVNRLEKQSEVVTSDDEDINLVYSDEEPIEFENSTETPPVPPNKDALCEQPSLSEEPDMQPECVDDGPESDAGPAQVFREEPDMQPECVDDGPESDAGPAQVFPAEQSVESEAAEDAARAEEGPAMWSPVCGSAAPPVCSLPDVSASARARRQLAAACAVRLERLRESRVPRAQQHTYCCDMCTGQFYTKSTLIRHIRTHYRCADCRKSFMMSSCLSRHEPNCTETKRKKRELTSALTRSHGEVYSCDECGKGFRIRSNLKKHIQRRHTVKHLLNSSQRSSYQNPKRHTQMSRTIPCANETNYKLNLQRHRKCHTKEKRFKCNYCDYKCHKNCNLQTHQRIHTAEKPFKCSFCDYKCRQKSHLQIHQRIHTGEKPFKCSYCDYKCRQKPHLQTHQRIHTGEKPFKCGYCDYKCSDKSALRCHQRIHTGEKPFKCKYCDYKCLQKSYLETHQRIHTGEKPLKCGSCDYKCRFKSNLRHHQRSHRNKAV